MDFDKLIEIADNIEAQAEEGLDETGEEEPCRSPLLNIRGSVKQLRDSIAFAQGQER